MIKGSGVLPKPLLAIFSLILFVLLMVFLVWKISIYFSSPCWAAVTEGLEPLITNTQRSAALIFDRECVDMFVITSSSAECIMFCNRQTDTDLIRACASKCGEGSESEPRSFIVAMPDQRGFVDSTIDAIGKGSYKWLFGGKTEVFALDCQVTGVSDFSECQMQGDSWICNPGESVTSYQIAVNKEDDGVTCQIAGAAGSQ